MTTTTARPDGQQEDRFLIVDGSQSAHCCFECTIVDTKKPYLVFGEQSKDKNGNPEFESVCECFTREDAYLICRALNAFLGPKLSAAPTTPPRTF